MRLSGRMPRISFGSVALIVLAGLISGCPDEAPLDAGPSDATPRTDASAVMDAASAADASEPADAASMDSGEFDSGTCQTISTTI